MLLAFMQDLENVVLNMSTHNCDVVCEVFAI
jgi:hypothetical protein